MSIDFDKLLDTCAFGTFLFDNLSSAVFLLDENTRVQKVNNAYKSLFSKEENDVLGMLCGNSIGCAFAVEQHKPCGSTTACTDCALRQSILQSIPDQDGIHTAYISRNFYIAGEPVYKHLRIKTKGIEFQGQHMTVVTVDDFTELEEQKNSIKEMANRDQLTGLYNRRYLFEAGAQLHSLALRGELNLVVAMLDVDHFKNVNDTYGHQAGDTILTRFAEILAQTLRKSDLLVRYGGEEFCVLLSVKSPSEAREVMENIRSRIEKHPFHHESAVIPATVSIGLCLDRLPTLEAMIQQADQLLYQAKANGRNQIVA